GGDALEAVDQRIAAIAVEGLGADPVLLLVVGADVEAAELSLASAVDDFGVGAGDDGAGLAAGAGAPGLAIPQRETGDDDGGVVLLGAVDAVGILIVHGDLIDLGGGLIELRAPGLAAIERHVGAAVIALDHVERVFGVDPDGVIVAVRGALGAEGLAAVGALEPVLVADVDHVGVIGVHAQGVVIERTRCE